MAKLRIRNPKLTIDAFTCGSMPNATTYYAISKYYFWSELKLYYQTLGAGPWTLDAGR